MVKDRRVDAMAYATGIPWSGIMDVAASQKIKLIPMTAEEQQKIYKAAPYRVPDTISAKTYSFQMRMSPPMPDSRPSTSGQEFLMIWFINLQGGWEHRKKC